MNTTFLLRQAGESRISQELKDQVWTCDFGMLRGKPTVLTRKHFVQQLNERWSKDTAGRGLAKQERAV